MHFNMADIGAFHCHKAELIIIIIIINSSFKTGTGSRLYASSFQVLTSVGHLPTSKIIGLGSASMREIMKDCLLDAIQGLEPITCRL